MQTKTVTATTARVYAYQIDAVTIDPEPVENFGRMIVARDPLGTVIAAGWDCAETRRRARRWLRFGLQLEFVSRMTVQRLRQASARHVFATTAPVGEVLSFSAATSALERF